MRTPQPWNIPTIPFTLAQAAGAGVTRRQLRTAVASGRVLRLRHGVFIAAEAAPDEPVPAHLVSALAQQTAFPSLVAHRTTAALALGLPLRSPSQTATAPPAFVLRAGPGVRSQRSASRTISRSSRLPPHDVITLPSGLRVTTPARTAVDLAAEMDLPEALMVLDAAARIELVAMSGSRHRAAYGDPRVLRAAVAPVQTALGSRARSSAQLRRAVSLVDVRRESPLESFSAGHFAQAGLPQPQLQARIRTPRGTYYADSLWPEQMLVGEADGAGKYEEADQVVREKLRDGALQDLGYAVLHWSGAEMFATPSRVVQRAARVLAARGWDGVPVDW